MQAAQQGDRVQVHYVKRWQDGSVATSAAQAPLELTVGVSHPRLPGLGTALVGLAPGDCLTLSVPAEQAHGPRDPARIYRLTRARFPQSEALETGKRLHLVDRRGRRRQVRIVEVRDQMVVVDNNHRHAGQALRLEVELVAILGAEAGEAQP